MRLSSIIAGVACGLLYSGLAMAGESHDDHRASLHHALTLEIGRTDEGAFSIEADGWYGGDQSRLWLRADAEYDGEGSEGSLEIYCGENIAEFWDALIGLRFDDAEAGGVSHFAVSLVGLAPQFIETEVSLYLSEDGDVSLRYTPSFEIYVTQRLIAEIEGEADLYFNEAPERLTGKGLASAELSLSLRYELTRRVAPMVKLTQEWSFGETRNLHQAAGEDASEESLLLGLYLRL